MTGSELRKFRQSIGATQCELGLAIGYTGTRHKVRNDVKKLERRGDEELDDHTVEKIELFRFRRLRQMRGSHAGR